jgi:hypothetical protein
MRTWLNVLALSAVLLLAAAPAEAAGKRRQASQLEKLQDSYAASIRWGDFEDAWQLVDPGYRDAHPMSDLAFERFQQIQISGYSDRNTTTTPEGDVVRNVELRVINKHTMAERTLRYREQWRWDPAAKRWWLVVGLPDLWDGE